jgi:ribosomal protein S3AE
MVRKNTNRLDDSFVMKTKGGKGVIIKTIMVTIRKTNKSATSLLRQQLKEYLKEEIGNSTFDTLVYNLSAYKVQSVLKKRLSKIYPLREIAVKVLRLAEKGLVKEEVVVEEKKEVSAEEKALPEKEAVSNAEPEKPEKTALPEMQEDLSEGEELQQ